MKQSYEGTIPWHPPPHPLGWHEHGHGQGWQCWMAETGELLTHKSSQMHLGYWKSLKSKASFHLAVQGTQRADPSLTWSGQLASTLPLVERQVVMT